MVVSLALMIAAVGWSVFAILIIFLIVPSIWEALFGQSGAALGALLALGAAVWSSGKMMRLADRVLNESDHAAPAETTLAPAEADVPADWHDYNAEIARSKRWAFYRRTRQFERLAELEAQTKQQQSP